MEPEDDPVRDRTEPSFDEAKLSDSNIVGIRVVHSEFPICGKPSLIAPGIWWLRLPLSGALDHVNVYLIEDGEGWTLVDCGSRLQAIESIYRQLPQLGSPFDRMIHRVIVTHYHPDHVGMAGYFANLGAEIWTTRTTWLQSKVLINDVHSVPNSEQIDFARRAGLEGLKLAAYCRRPPSNYRKLVHELPYSYRRIQEEDSLRIGNRQWKVLVGHGHAAEHALLLSDDGIAITGDQILLGIATNLSLHVSEPDADLVSEWIVSCRRFQNCVADSVLCLPGHNLPFYGAALRCKQLEANIEAALRRLLPVLSKPKTVVECLSTVYGRDLRPEESSQSLAETMGFMNHLERAGYVRKILGSHGAFRWLRVSNLNYQFEMATGDRQPSSSMVQPAAKTT